MKEKIRREGEVSGWVSEEERCKEKKIERCILREKGQ